MKFWTLFLCACAVVTIFTLWAAHNYRAEEQNHCLAMRVAESRYVTWLQRKNLELKLEMDGIKENLVVYKPGFYQPDWSLHLEDESK